jgi:hypothetical protein
MGRATSAVTNTSALTARPSGVETLMGPDVAPVGTRAVSVVAVAELVVARVVLKASLSRAGFVSKLAPVIVTSVPGGPTCGVNPLIVGEAVDAVTVKGWPVVAVPAGAVTLMGPVLAVAGTVTTSWVVDAEDTAAATLLNVTVFWVVTALNPVPEIVTVAPTGPPFGVKSMIETVEETYRDIARMLPTAS